VFSYYKFYGAGISRWSGTAQKQDARDTVETNRFENDIYES